MSILMPALAKVREQAKDVLGQSNLKQWGTIFEMYAGQNDSTLPAGWYASVPKGDETYYRGERLPKQCARSALRVGGISGGCRQAVFVVACCDSWRLRQLRYEWVGV
jgi:hypothetical protein